MKLAFYNGPVADAANTSTLYDSAIEARQWIGGAGYAARFVHVEFVFDEVGAGPTPVGLPGAFPRAIQAGDANGSLCYSSSPRDGGVRFKWIDLTDGKWVLANLGVLNDEQLAKALAFCDWHVGMKYDWLAIWGFALPFGEHENSKRFCSDACVELIQRSIVAATVSRRIIEAVDPLVRWRTDPARLYQAVAPTSAIKLGGPIIQGARG